MTHEDSWQKLAREPAIRTPALARILERAPKLGVTVDLEETRLRLGFGKATLDLVPTFTVAASPGRCSGGATIVPPTAKHADAILAALVRAVEAEVPARPHPPGFRPPPAVTLEGFHAVTEGGSLVWIAVDFGADDDGSPGLRLHLVRSPGKARGSLHVELPRGAARRDKLLAALARSLRDGWPPRRVPATDLRCASAAPWLTTTPLALPHEVDLTSARWGGHTLFAARREEEATLLVRIDGPTRCTAVARIDSPDVAFYPSPTGAHVLLEISSGVPHPLGCNLSDGHAVRELLEVATGLRTRLVEKHESFAFGDTSGAAAWSADGRRIAMSGSAPFAGGSRSAVLVYDLASGAFVDATPLDGSFLFSHWDGPAIWLHDGALENPLAFRWEPGRSSPRADALLGRPSPTGRFALLAAEGRTRVVDRHLGAYAPSLPATPGGHFWAGDAWVTDEVEPRVFDLATGLYRYLAPPSQVLHPNFAETAPLAIFNDGAGWQWGSAADLAVGAASGAGAIGGAAATAGGAGDALAFDHATPLPARHAFGERRARRIEEASILAEDDQTGEARRVVAAIEARLRAEAALSAGNAKAVSGVGGASAAGNGAGGGGDHAVEAALKHYEAAVRDAPDLYEALHNCEVALAHLGHHPERLQVAAFLCDRFPISSGAWLTRSIALHKAGANAAALDAIERAFVLDADGVDLPRHRARTTDLLHQRACVHVARGQHDDAIVDVAKILAADPAAKDRLLADDDLAPLRNHPLLGGEPANKRRRSPAKAKGKAASGD